MNSVNLIGRLVKDPEIRLTASGASSLPFCLAVSRNDKNKTTDFIDCQAWNKTAEFIVKYFKKGKPIEISGKLQTRSYEKDDGTKVKVTEIYVTEVGFVLSDSNPSGSESGETESESGIPFEI